MDWWNNGLVEQWIDGTMDWWNNGVMEYWNVGLPAIQQSNNPEIHHSNCMEGGFLMAQENGTRRLALIASKGTLDWAYPPFILASAAAMDW